MPSPAARIRVDLQARTGVDFAGYADDEFVDAISGWSGLVGLGRDLGVAVGVGLLVVALSVVIAVVPQLDELQPTGIVIGGVIAGIGATALAFGWLVRRRIPQEVGRVFDVSERLSRRVADDLAAGILDVSVSDAARGVVLAAAIPALVRSSRRRFPLVGTLVAPIVGSMLARALARMWPRGTRTVPASGREGTIRRLDRSLESIRVSVIPRLAVGVRWATLPLLLAGGSVTLIGSVVVVLALLG